jgi:parallel beta-helix repeat protein
MRRKRKVFTFMLSFFVMSMPFNSIDIAKAETSYYVSAVSGSDSNAGTFASPWRHIQYAVDHVTGGSVINIAPGTYNEKVTISCKSDLTLQNSIPTDNPVITGTGSTSGNLITVTGSHDITLAGLELCSFTGKYVEGVVVSNGSYNITIKGCKIHDISTTTTTGGAHAILVEGNTNTAITNVTIDSNEVYNINPGYSESVTIVANVDGWSIKNNKVHDIKNIGIDAAGHYNWGCTQAALNQARNGIISGNIVYNCNSPYASCAGIYVDGGRDITVEKNIVYGSQYGFSIGCENTKDQADNRTPATASGIKLINNLIYNNSEIGIGIGGYNGTSTGKVTDSLVLNNTFYKNGQSGISIAYSDKLSIFNNIIYGTGGSNYLVINDSVNPVTNLNMDNNVYYDTNGAENCNFLWNSTLIKGLSAWKTKMKSVFALASPETNSKFGDPNFVNAANSNFELQPYSYAIDAGQANSLSGSTDLAGNPRVYNGVIIDCGAYEYQSVSTATPPPTPAPTATPTPAPTATPKPTKTPRPRS